MKYLLSLDPGLRDCWFTKFYAGELIQTIRVRNPLKKERGPAAWLAMAEKVAETGLMGMNLYTFVAEIPQVYGAGKQKGDQDDIMQLAGIVGAVTAVVQPAHAFHYYPREWKAQLPKEACADRVWNCLSFDEKQRVTQYGALQHNIMDSIGIGLKKLDRFNVSETKKMTQDEIKAKLQARLKPSNVDFSELGPKTGGGLSKS